jgi:threonine/homoserine/homoserine lactone efflux protein
MDTDLFISLTLFVLVMSITPGPNNLMVLASGLNFGFWRTAPHMFGVVFGFGFMIVLVGLGFGQLFVVFPQAYTVLKYAGAAYMLWLAWQIARSGPVGEGRGRGEPLSFLGAAAFQWLNPKGWVMAITAMTTYTIAGEPVATALITSIVFMVVGLPSVGIWVVFGTALSRVLNDPRKLKLFNWAMAILLVLSLVPLIWE